MNTASDASVLKSGVCHCITVYVSRGIVNIVRYTRTTHTHQHPYNLNQLQLTRHIVMIERHLSDRSLVVSSVDTIFYQIIC